MQAKLVREGADQKLDLWLEIGHFQIFPSKVFLPDKSCTLAPSIGVPAPLLVLYVSIKHTRRGVAAHNVEADLHVNNACGHTFADAVRGAPPRTRNPSLGGGAGLGRNTCRRPLSYEQANDLLLGDANLCACTGLAGGPRRPPRLPHRGRNRICIYVPQSPCVNPMDELLSASNGQRAGAVAPSTKAIGSLLQGGGAIRPPP